MRQPLFSLIFSIEGGFSKSFINPFQHPRHFGGIDVFRQLSSSHCESENLTHFLTPTKYLQKKERDVLTFNPRSCFRRPLSCLRISEAKKYGKQKDKLLSGQKLRRRRQSPQDVEPSFGKLTYRRNNFLHG